MNLLSMHNATVNNINICPKRVAIRYGLLITNAPHERDNLKDVNFVMMINVIYYGFNNVSLHERVSVTS